MCYAPIIVTEGMLHVFAWMHTPTGEGKRSLLACAGAYYPPCYLSQGAPMVTELFLVSLRKLTRKSSVTIGAVHPRQDPECTILADIKHPDKASDGLLPS